MQTMTADILAGYRKLYVFYFGKAAMNTSTLVPGRVSVTVRDVPGLSAEGNLTANGALSGMSPIYGGLALQDGDSIEAEPVGASTLVITRVIRSGLPSSSTPLPEPSPIPPREPAFSVFQRQRLRALHIEMFRPENLNRWEPETETDVYMAFGVLQQYTRHRYCCATSKALLDRLGFQAPTKPDAILVDNDTRAYLIAEFKICSSDFALNHQPEDVDVLVVWEDDEIDRSKLPPEVVCLREIAREAAQELFRG